MLLFGDVLQIWTGSASCGAVHWLGPGGPFPGSLAASCWLCHLYSCQHPSIFRAAGAGPVVCPAPGAFPPYPGAFSVLGCRSGQTQPGSLCLALGGPPGPRFPSCAGWAGKPSAPGHPGSVTGVRVPHLPSVLSVPTEVPVCCSYFSDGFICPHLHKKYHAPHPNEQAHLAVPASSPLSRVGQALLKLAVPFRD